jgi:hypothetical protein
MGRPMASASTDYGDRLPTDAQVALAVWFGEYKNVRVPDRVFLTVRSWFGWLKAHVTQIDREDAREAQVDFGVRLDPCNPVSIIGALKYRAAVQETSIVDRAVRQLLKGVHPYEAQENFGLTDVELDEAARKAEVEHGYDIDWGSF